MCYSQSHVDMQCYWYVGHSTVVPRDLEAQRAFCRIPNAVRVLLALRASKSRGNFLNSVQLLFIGHFTINHSNNAHTPDNNGLNAQTMDSEPPPVPNAFLSSPITRFLELLRPSPHPSLLPSKPATPPALSLQQPAPHSYLLSLTCKTKSS